MAPPRISIVIKTLNEERNIARALRSIQAEAGKHDVEVIVADSLSTDQTVRIGVGMRGRYGLASNGFFIDDWSLQRVEN